MNENDYKLESIRMSVIFSTIWSNYFNIIRIIGFKILSSIGNLYMWAFFEKVLIYSKGYDSLVAN